MKPGGGTAQSYLPIMPMVFTVCNTSLPVIVLGNTYTCANINIPALLSTVPTVCVHSVLYSEFVQDFPPFLSLRANWNRQTGGQANLCIGRHSPPKICVDTGTEI